MSEETTEVTENEEVTAEAKDPNALLQAQEIALDAVVDQTERTAEFIKSTYKIDEDNPAAGLIDAAQAGVERVAEPMVSENAAKASLALGSSSTSSLRRSGAAALVSARRMSPREEASRSLGRTSSLARSRVSSTGLIGRRLRRRSRRRTRRMNSM